jgi:hypothetical protein
MLHLVGCTLEIYLEHYYQLFQFRNLGINPNSPPEKSQTFHTKCNGQKNKCLKAQENPFSGFSGCYKHTDRYNNHDTCSGWKCACLKQLWDLYSQVDNLKPKFSPPSFTKEQDLKVLHTILFHRDVKWF